MEVVINGIVYVPKEKDKEVESVILEEHLKFEVHPKELGEMNWEDAQTECALLGEGWRLPTKAELLLMYENKDVIGGLLLPAIGVVRITSATTRGTSTSAMGMPTPAPIRPARAMCVLLGQFKKMKHFLKYLTVWISQNLAIPFWTVGHLHLMVNIYEDIIEVVASCGMNLIVATGFIIDYIEQRKNR